MHLKIYLISFFQNTFRLNDPWHCDGAYESDTFSIVMVHGLQGHPHRTWTAGNGIMWPRDLLPVDVPNARVMTYGYHSIDQSPAQICELSLFYQADDLVSRVKQVRRQTASDNRPIIFIAHSLGGIVVKSALVRLRMSSIGGDKDDVKIARSTSGILFLGTPQRSHGTVTLGDLIRRIVSRVASNTFEESESMNEEADWLEARLEQFKSLAKLTKIYYCIENHPSRPNSSHTVLVPSPSAVISNCCKEGDRINLNGDHRSICKYLADDNIDYRQVVKAIERTMKDTKAKSLHEKVRPRSGYAARTMLGNFVIPNKLEVISCDHFSSRRPGMEALQAWLGEKDEFQSKAPVVLIHGRSGSGKTSLAQRFAINNRTRFDFVGYVDCQSTDSINSDFGYIVHRLLKHYIDRGCRASKDQTGFAHSLGLGNLLDESGHLLFIGDFAKDVAKEWLERPGNSRWLMIFDNVKEPQSIEQYFPRSRNGHIIVASTHAPKQKFGKVVALKHLRCLEHDRGVECDCDLPIRTLSGRLKDKDFARVERLHWMLAFVDFAKASMGNHPPFETLQSYKAEQESRSNSDFIEKYQYHLWKADAYALLETAYATLNVEASRFLHICSFYGSDRIPIDLLERGVHVGGHEGKSDTAPQIAANPEHLSLT